MAAHDRIPSEMDRTLSAIYREVAIRHQECLADGIRRLGLTADVYHEPPADPHYIPITRAIRKWLATSHGEPLS